MNKLLAKLKGDLKNIENLLEDSKKIILSYSGTENIEVHHSITKDNTVEKEQVVDIKNDM